MGHVPRLSGRLPSQAYSDPREYWRFVETKCIYSTPHRPDSHTVGVEQLTSRDQVGLLGRDSGVPDAHQEVPTETHTCNVYLGYQFDLLRGFVPPRGKVDQGSPHHPIVSVCEASLLTHGRNT